MFSVEVKQLGKKFGNRDVFSKLSFSHSQGVLGIAGANGSGKSTLLKCLAGLLNPTTGSIEWRANGGGISRTELKEHLGYTAPYINLYHELTVLENINLILQLRSQSITPDKMEQLLTDLQLTRIREQEFGELSTGQQQRVRLACALVYGPSVLFLDEPGANLDTKGETLVRIIIDRFREEQKLVLLSSNDERELEMADRVVVLDSHES